MFSIAREAIEAANAELVQRAYPFNAETRRNIVVEGVDVYGFSKEFRIGWGGATRTDQAMPSRPQPPAKRDLRKPIAIEAACAPVLSDGIV